MYIGNWIFIILVLISFVGLYKIFQKTGRTTWKALVPFLNFYEWIKLLERPWWWVFLMIVPGVNILMYSVLSVITAQYFGKRKGIDLTIAAFVPFLYPVYLGFSEKEKLTGIEDLKKKKGGFIKTWLDPLIFAVIAASVIRTFFLEAFTIPTSSLEKSLMVGDFLFVNKFAYGSKTPQTPLAFPFAHHTLPLVNKKSYLEWIRLPYFRLPGYSTIKNGDIVVFNYPDGDTVALNAQDMSYYQLCRDMAEMVKQNDINNNNPLKPNEYYTSVGWQIVNTPTEINPYKGIPFGEVVGRPVDKREHYVKRCVAIAGDKLEIKNGDLYINDKLYPTPENAQHHYIVKFLNVIIDEKWLDKNDIYTDEAKQIYWDETHKTLVQQIFQTKQSYPYNNEDTSLIKTVKAIDTIVYELNLTAGKAEQIRKLNGCISVTRTIKAKGVYDNSIFPHNRNYPWNNDNFGPYTLPKAGATVKIDTSNICLYDRIIDVYDGNDLEIKNGKVFINQTEATSYTFKQDYYWLMGDNRHNSADSRSWGVVPFDHVVGKPVFVWLSIKDPEKNPVSGKGVVSSLFKNSKNGKYRWERFFCFVGDNGLSKSYFIHFLVIVAGWWGIAKYLKKRKEKKEASK